VCVKGEERGGCSARPEQAGDTDAAAADRACGGDGRGARGVACVCTGRACVPAPCVSPPYSTNTHYTNDRAAREPHTVGTSFAKPGSCSASRRLSTLEHFVLRPAVSFDGTGGRV